MNWLELSIAVDQEAAESVSELFATYGYNGGVVIEPAWLPHESEPGEASALQPYHAAPELPVTLRTYLPLNEQTEGLCHRIEQALWHLGQLRPIGTLTTRLLQEEDWENTWKQYYTVQQIGKHIVIVPSWLVYTTQPEDVLLHMDPGMAFGTGLHPTTQLCLRLLEIHMHPGLSVLDLGTGSGILAIAAVRLGANHVAALDIDGVAVEVAQKNAQNNGVSHKVHIEQGSLNQMTRQPVYDLIVANIIAGVLIELALAMAQVLARGGILISSGILLEREDEVALALAAAGLQQHERHQEGEWVAFVHAKELPASDSAA